MSIAPHDDRRDAPASGLRLRILFVIASVCLIGLFFWVRDLSAAFYYGGVTSERPIRLTVSVLVGAGVVYLGAMYSLYRLPSAFWLTVSVFLVGVAMRGLCFYSTPILEDDFYRYLWDGVVTANGYNPYRYAPVEMIRISDAPESLRALAEGGPIERVNHPRIGTIYPPAAQGAFALAAWIEPWGLGAWRMVLLLFDFAAFGILLLTLRSLERPLHWGAAYWLNPVLLLECVNSAHMDALLLPFIAGAFYASVRGRPVAVTVLLAFAAAIKIWPVMLVPLLLRGQGLTLRQSALSIGLFVVLLGVLFLPLLATRDLDGESGFVAYGERWEMNDALFMAGLKASEFAVAPLELDDPDPAVNLLARMLAAGTLGALLIALLWRPPVDPIDRAGRAGLAVGAMFMLSPTQFPWYYTWLLPFLVFKPRPAFLVLSAMLPIYYLKFYYEARGNVNFFHHVVVWIEYAPVFGLLAYEWLVSRRRRVASAHA